MEFFLKIFGLDKKAGQLALEYAIYISLAAVIFIGSVRASFIKNALHCAVMVTVMQPIAKRNISSSSSIIFTEKGAIKTIANIMKSPIKIIS